MTGKRDSNISILNFFLVLLSYASCVTSLCSELDLFTSKLYRPTDLKHDALFN